MIEAVVRGMPREFFKQPFGAFRPDVVVAGRKVQRIPVERSQDLLNLSPFRFRRGVIQTLNCVSGADHESRAGGRRLLPDLLIYTRRGLPRPVSEDYEA